MGQAFDEVDAALACLGADQLRVVVRDLLREVDERAHGRVVDSLIARAARTGSGWVPAPLARDEVAEALSFAAAARRVGHADPCDVDEHLRRGSGAFLRRDYAAAHRILGALLPPVAEGEIDLGQHELAGEVLGVDLGECAARYVVSVYLVSASPERAGAVLAAIGEARGVGSFWEPIREMERVAMEPLPLLEDFLPRWRALLEREAGRERRSDWDADEDRWLREVVRRMEGADGLAKLARSTRRADDLRAWCGALVDGGDWKAALPAFDEASGLAASGALRGELLDGAALAAQEHGRADVPARLESAWRACPSMLRLCRWLGSAGGGTRMRRPGAEALETCPPKAHRQRALLYLLQGDFGPAAALLAKVPGLGWSDGEHPGHLLFLFLERVSPAIERVDSSSGAIGTAVNHAVEALVAIIVEAPAGPEMRDAWLERLFEAHAADQIPYIERLADFRGELCVSKELASSWADRLLPVTRMALSPDKSLRGHFHGTSACLSALCRAERYDHLLDVLRSESFWPYKRWAVKALGAAGRQPEAIDLAEASRGPWTNDADVDALCEELLLSAGLVEVAYARYGLRASRGGTYLATLRAVAKKYAHKPVERILGDLVASTPGEEGKWFAAGKELGLYDAALQLARTSPCDPRTLARAARDHLAERPSFALEAGFAALSWLVHGFGYEITGADVWLAYSATMKAAEALGREEETRERIRELVAHGCSGRADRRPRCGDSCGAPSRADSTCP